MSAIDPRLAPVLASERRSGRGLAVFGVVLLALGGGMFAMSTSRVDMAGQVTGVIMGLVFGLPGLWLIRSWLRGPEVTAIVRLLTKDRASIKEWDFEYVSVQGGPTQTRVKLFTGNGRYREVTLAPEEAKPVMAYVAELSPRREK